MKDRKQNLLIVLLLIALAISLLLNWLQGEQVSRLMNEIGEMEYIQSVLSSHIEELEREDSGKDGNE